MSRSVVPSRMNLGVYKGKIVAAKKGHELLKKKCDALKTKFRVIMIALLEAKKNLGEDCFEASMFLAKSQYSAGEYQQNVKDAVKKASIRVEIDAENIAGVQLPNFLLREQDDLDSGMGQIGISRGGQIIQRTREKFKELLHLMVKIASLQTSFLTLDEVIKVTNRRVNALEYLVIPNFIDTMNYIQQELDEQSREDYYRLKKVLDNKKKMIAEDAANKEKRDREALKEAMHDAKHSGDHSGPMEGQKDPDVLF